MSDIVLQIAAFIAAFVQSTVGIGFGMIAGPVVLIVLNDPAAVVISTLLSWLIALALLPSLRTGTDWPMLWRLSAGAALGLPFGLALLGASGIGALKLTAAVVIGGLTLAMMFGLPGVRTPGRGMDYLFGIIAGMFGGCLAIQGPLFLWCGRGLESFVGNLDSIHGRHRFAGLWLVVRNLERPRQLGDSGKFLATGIGRLGTVEERLEDDRGLVTTRRDGSFPGNGIHGGEDHSRRNLEILRPLIFRESLEIRGHKRVPDRLCSLRPGHFLADWDLPIPSDPHTDRNAG